MATITRGYTFGATEQVTNSKLHSLVDSATISSIVQADLTAALGLISRGTSAPSDSDQLWMDTSTTPVTLKLNDGTNWIVVGEHNVLTNRTGATTSIGQVVIIDTTNANSFKFTSTEGDLLFAGITIEAIANATSQDLITGGFANILLETSASAGCFLRSSTATGKAVQAASGATGIFALVTQAGTASAMSRIFGHALQLTTSASAASQAEMETGTNTSNPVVPGRQHFHQSAAKAWSTFNVTGTPAIIASYNMSGAITDNGTGDVTVLITTDVSSSDFAAVVTALHNSATNEAEGQVTARAVGSVRCYFHEDGGAALDVTEGCVIIFGDI